MFEIFNKLIILINKFLRPHRIDYSTMIDVIKYNVVLRFDMFEIRYLKKLVVYKYAYMHVI